MPLFRFLPPACLLCVSRSSPNALSMRKRQSPAETPLVDYPLCEDVDLNRLSCYPRPGTLLVQGDSTKFIWNTNYQGAQGRGQLDLHLYCDRASGGPELVYSWTDVANSLGNIDFALDDSILPSIYVWEGPDVTWPYYFVVKEGGARLSDDDTRRAPFSLLQTAAPTSLLALAAETLSNAVQPQLTTSTSYFPESASSTVLVAIQPFTAFTSVYTTSSSGSLFSATTTITTNALPTTFSTTAISNLPSGGFTTISTLITSQVPLPFPTKLYSPSPSSEAIQSTAKVESSSPLPTWGLTLIAVFGSLFFLILFVLFYCGVCITRKRKKRRRATLAESPGSEDTPSMPSTPTSAHGSRVASPLMREPEDSNRATSPESRALLGHDPTIHPTEASAMADAFRKALRRPSFPDSGDEGSRPGTIVDVQGQQLGSEPRSPLVKHGSDGSVANREGKQLMQDELLQEGQSLRSVPSRKGELHGKTSEKAGVIR